MPSRRQLLQRATPLAKALPGAQFGEGHSRVLNAGTEEVWAALHDLRWSELRLARPLMWIRTGGAKLELDQPMCRPPSPAAPLYEEPPRVSASGMIGRPWKLRPEPGPVVTGLDEVRAFTDPGWLKYGMEWVLSPAAGGRTLVETVTLCEATDSRAFRRFALYWSLIRPFSGLLRHDILAALARRVG